ncbi:MAG: acyltransferase family protein [Candidatus Thorarchaeota archaeon]
MEAKRPYYFQLDVLKTIAIAFVVLDHSLTWEIKSLLGSVFWERLSIPFFLIVMGFNMGVSFKYRRAESLKELYSLDYFVRKVKRYVLPFSILYFASFVLGVTLGYVSTGLYGYLFFLPFWGPGNWFIPLLFSSILVFPLLYWMFQRHPVMTIGICFLSELLMQTVLWFLYPVASTELDWFLITAIRVNILFFLPAVGIGLWFSKDYNLRSKHNRFVYPYLVFSLFFMFDYATGVLYNLPNAIGQIMSTIQLYIVGDYTLFFYGYAAFLFVVAMLTLPQTAKGPIQKFIQRTGRSTYHILLFQIFWMSIVYWTIAPLAAMEHRLPTGEELGWSTPLLYIPYYLLNLAASFAGGMIWYELEKRVLHRRKSSDSDIML